MPEDVPPAPDSASAPTQGRRVAGCALCESTGGHEVWFDADWRVVRIDDDDDFPVFYRLISVAHVREFSDLSAAARLRCIDLICTIERTLIEQLRPTKMNLATLGNAVPHLHWHVVARFEWDSRFPEPIWASRLRVVAPPPRERVMVELVDIDRCVAHRLSAVV